MVFPCTDIIHLLIASTIIFMSTLKSMSIYLLHHLYRLFPQKILWVWKYHSQVLLFCFVNVLSYFLSEWYHYYSLSTQTSGSFSVIAVSWISYQFLVLKGFQYFQRQTFLSILIVNSSSNPFHISIDTTTAWFTFLKLTFVPFRGCLCKGYSY